MSCQVEQIADCGDISSIGRALFIPEREDTNWLTQCCISLSACGNLIAIGYKNRLCLLNAHWISATDTNSFLITWSGTLSSDISAILVLPICPSQQSSQNGPDWFCVIVGFKNGSVGFYTNTGHLLLIEKLEEKPVMKISCHTGAYGTLLDDIQILFPNCECIISGSNLFQTLKSAKSQLARVQAGIQNEYTVDSRNIGIRKWMFVDQEAIHDAAVVGVELKNTYDHLLSASTYGGYDVWYRSVPPVNTLILSAGVKPYIGFHYALEGGTTPPLQDVARAVANKIKLALPGWLGGGSTENTSVSTEPQIRSETSMLRNGLYDTQRHGNMAVVSPDRRLAAFVDSFGRVAVLDIKRGHLVRLFKGCRDAQCAFIQVFETDTKKPLISVVTEIRRAIFLIIYNPKKGLVDIRLMQRGNRVAVFTASKNGQLIYNTSGLVGAEKNYTSKTANLPEFQCVLIDPDGKLKKFNIPFFYSLEGEHSNRSQDLHTLKELRDHIKKTSVTSDEFEDYIIEKVSKLTTLDLKKHCLEILIRNCEIPASIIMNCLHIFWKCIECKDLDNQENKIKIYFGNLGLITLFYRHINNEATDDMEELITDIHAFFKLDQSNDFETWNENDTKDNNDFHLLEDDNCILERLLTLAQENEYKDKQHTRVTFADSNNNNYKEFVSCFVLDESNEYLSLKSDVSLEKLNSLANNLFKSIYKMNNLQMLTKYLKQSNINPKEIVRLMIIHLMNTALENITVEVIEKFIAVLYYVCSVSGEAINVKYNEISHWWQSIRDILVDMSCPLRSMIISMACKATSKIFESKSFETEEVWETVTKEYAKWGILIGKLEDISILSIILMFKETFIGKSLPKLEATELNINLKYIYTRGKGSVTELISKWLCGMGVAPEAIIANELIEIRASCQFSSDDSNEEPDSSESLFVENNCSYINENVKIFKWLSLLRRQFPLSTKASYIISNMCWEYAITWQKNLQNMEYLTAVAHCLTNVTDIHIRLGLFSIIWSTYIKHIFDISCKLVNKVGRLPKDPLCLQDIGFNNTNLINFLEIITKYLENFQICSNESMYHEKLDIQYEKIWDESNPSLVEVAQQSKNVNADILNLNYQIACTIYYQSHFNLKYSKPLDSLYDIDYQYIFEALTGNVLAREISMKASEKIRNPRMKFLTKLIRAAVETITSTGCDSSQKVFNSDECNAWIEKIFILAELWNIENDFIRRQQVVALYHLGYDSVAENVIGYIKELEAIIPSLIAITIQRFKRSLEHSSNQAEWIVTMPPQLFKKLQNTPLDASIPAYPSLDSTILVLQKLLNHISKKTAISQETQQNIKLVELFIESCEILIRRKLN